MMSNMGKTSADIKKKLSLNDYNKPAYQQDVASIMVDHHQQTDNSIPVEQHASTSTPAHHQNGTSAMVNQYASTSVPVNKRAEVNKIKATYYLGQQENYMLTQLFVQSINSNKKSDKSALVCQAIRLLYDQLTKE